MKMLRSHDILSQAPTRRYITRFSIIVVLIAMYEVCVRSGLSTHLINYIVAGWWGQ